MELIYNTMMHNTHLAVQLMMVAKVADLIVKVILYIFNELFVCNYSHLLCIKAGIQTHAVSTFKLSMMYIERP